MAEVPVADRVRPVPAEPQGTPVSFVVPVLDYRVSFVIPPIPFQTEILAGADWLDTKIPTIRGRPAIRECLANARSGVTVALVSLPLSISLAIAADALPVQGCITAVWAGLFSSVLGGSHYNIVGPTGALSGILSYYSLKYCPPAPAACYSGILPLLAILSGLISLLVWSSGLDKFLVFIPGAVMHGFTLGVAFIISANQLNFLLGLPKLPRHPEFLANLGETFSNLQSISPLAVCFFAVTFYVLFNLVKKHGKVPWAVILAILGIILGVSLEGTRMQLQTIRTRYGDLSIQLIQWIDQSTLPPLTVDTATDLLRGSVSIAAVSVLETLISARIADRMTKTLFDQPAEVFSTAVANLASGVTGGIPATAALARTALNVKSGATSRGSGIVSAICIALLCSVLFSSFKYLPLPIVATILVNTAYRMVEWHEIKTLIDTDMPMMVVCVVTAVICAVQDPTMGIVYGIGLSMVRVLLSLMHGHSHLTIYSGARLVLTEHFLLTNGKDSVAGVRARYLKERDAAEVAREKLRMQKALAVADSSNAIAAAAIALRVAQDDAHATSVAISAASTSRNSSSSSSSALRRQARAALLQVGGGAGAGSGGGGEKEGQGAAGGSGEEGKEGEEEDEEPVYVKGCTPLPGDERLPRVAVYGMPGYCTYVGAKSHLDRLRGLFVDSTCIPGIEVVCFDLAEIKYADPDALEAIGDIIDELSRVKKTAFLLGATPSLRRLISHLHWSHMVVHFEDYAGLLANLRAAAKLDEDRLAVSTDGTGSIPTLAEMVVSRVKELTAAPFLALPVSLSSSSAAATAAAAAASPSAGTFFSSSAGGSSGSVTLGELGGTRAASSTAASSLQ